MTCCFKKRLRPREVFKRFFILAAVSGAVFVAGCKSPAKTEADCGPLPSNAQAKIEKYFRAELGNPDAAEFRYEPTTMGRFKKSGSSDWGYAWRIKVWVRGRTAQGGYTRPEPYWFFFSKGRLVYKISPQDIPEDEWRS
ncbi:MAG TPA: hypothetical protein VH598_08470 [Verrucomicrobiae bacterium]|nr:hypothetical protein [Verrucomicrobiae bacterium]